MKSTLSVLMICGLVASLAQPVAYAQYGNQSGYNPSVDHPTEILNNLSMMSPEQRVDTSLALLLGPSASGPPIATQILLSVHPQYVVPRLTDAILYDFRLEEQERRRYAFSVLAAKQDWNFPTTYDILSRGLADYRVDFVCRKALEQAPPGLRAVAVPYMSTRLNEWRRGDPRVTETVLEILGSYGSIAGGALDGIAYLFKIDTAGFPENRVTAGKVLAQVAGLEGALPLYQNLDTLEMKGALAGLLYLGESDPTPYRSGKEETKRARQIVSDAFIMPSAVVLQSAFKAVPTVYGDDMYVRTDSGSELNPDLKNALIAAAEKQTDERLRGALVMVLRQYENAAHAR
jgi:hypothetical protein